MRFGCKTCGAPTEWSDALEGPEDYCDLCLETLIERSRQRAEWNAYHDEPCPEIELTPMPKAKP